MKVLSQVKKDMEFNTGLSSLIEVLKNIAVAQFRTSEQKVTSFEKLILTIESFFDLVNPETISHPFLKAQHKKQIVIAVTSDSGLLGGLNTKVINSAVSEIESIPGRLVVIGEKGKYRVQELGIPFTSFTGIEIEEQQRHAQATEVRDYVVDIFLKDNFGYLKIVYPRPYSLTVQRVETVSFLPFSASKKRTLAKKAVTDIIMESDPADIVEYIVHLMIAEKIFEILGLSRLAEFGARFVHLQESTQKLSDLSKKLKQEYFGIRHELIDRNMRDLFASRLLYGRKG